MRFLLKQMPDALTLLRLVCAFLFVWAVYKHDWGFAYLLMVVGALSDPLDGRLARMLDLPSKRWFGMTGKQFNELASGSLAVMPPIALIISFGLAHYNDWDRPHPFALWVGLGIFMFLATVWFNWFKNPVHLPNPVHRETVEVLQGWFTGFIWVCCGAQVLWLHAGGNIFYWLVAFAVVVVGISASRHQWFTRPELTS